MAVSSSGKSKIWHNRKAVGHGRASAVLGYKVRSSNMVDVETRLPSFGRNLHIRYLTSSLLLFPSYPSLVLPTLMATRRHGHPLLPFPALHLLYALLTTHHHSFVIVVIVTVEIYHRCRRDPSLLPSRSIIIVVEICHHRHQDSSPLSSRSVIVVVEIHHRCHRNPSLSPSRSIIIVVEIRHHRC
ncbi:uncharacterized protein G2W53_033084 [Senna tora]|uniref:Uncharacterized protein n=1 Tax=Senna tora TaxID=362788 RepID=A0A834SX09_9FABA|nr:uncharacterized protein G2W53_033084 [Senna tora]